MVKREATNFKLDKWHSFPVNRISWLIVYELGHTKSYLRFWSLACMYNLEFQFVWTSIIITGSSLSTCDLEKVKGAELKRLKYFNRAAKNSNRAVTVLNI